MKHATEVLIANKNKPSFWLLHSLGWLTYVLVFTIENLFFNKGYGSLGITVVYPLILSGFTAAVLTLPLRYIYRRCWTFSPKILFIIIVISCIAVAAMWTPAKNLTMWFSSHQLGTVDMGKNTIDDAFKINTLFYSISHSFFMIFVWSSLYFAINFHFRLLSEKQLHLEAVRLSHIAQIKMLRYQINPHFLFNTLNAISTLVLMGNNDRANGMLTRLSTFLRFSLDNDPEKKIRLFEELKALMLYLEIEKTRFNDRLTVKFEIETKAEALLLPSLLLQPLVENSIKYAIANMSTGGIIEIKAKCKSNKLMLEVADNGPNTQIEPKVDRPTAKGCGVGIKNIVDRLKVLYPNKHNFEIVKNEPSGFRVLISIPMETA